MPKQTIQDKLELIKQLVSEIEAELQEGEASAKKGHSDPGDDDEGPNG